MVLGSNPVAVTSLSDFAPASSKEFLDIQATIECGFTLKRVRDMARTYSHYWNPQLKKKIKKGLLHFYNFSVTSTKKHLFLPITNCAFYLQWTISMMQKKNSVSSKWLSVFFKWDHMLFIPTYQQAFVVRSSNVGHIQFHIISMKSQNSSWKCPRTVHVLRKFWRHALSMTSFLMSLF